jgi:hypothetical protein
VTGGFGADDIIGIGASREQDTLARGLDGNCRITGLKWADQT